MVNNEFGKLKSCIVGNELNFSKKLIDFTFKVTYNSNLKFNLNNIYDTSMEYIEINQELIEERIDDLNNLQKVLEENGVKIIRPNTYTKPELFEYKASLKNTTHMHSPASNVRDLVLTYKDLVIETSNFVINRIGENELFLPQVKEAHPNYKYINIASKIEVDKIDIDPWEKVQERLTPKYFKKYNPYIDAANIVKINNDLLCNIGSVNQYLGFLELKKELLKWYPDINIHEMYIADSHIDGTLMPLKEGVFLVNEQFLNTNYIKNGLPEKFKNWEIIYAQDQYVEDKKYWDLVSKSEIALASSRGMDINVLSLDRNRVLIQEDAVRTAELLYKNKFEPVPIRFRHGEIFAGGIHCSTLDLERED